MGYYHIELTPASKGLCTIVLPWGKYEYQQLPMGLCNSPNVFLEKMSDIMAGLEFVRAYINDLLIMLDAQPPGACGAALMFLRYLSVAIRKGSGS